MDFKNTLPLTKMTTYTSYLYLYVYHPFVLAIFVNILSSIAYILTLFRIGKCNSLETFHLTNSSFC